MGSVGRCVDRMGRGGFERGREMNCVEEAEGSSEDAENVVGGAVK